MHLSYYTHINRPQNRASACRGLVGKLHARNSTSFTRATGMQTSRVVYTRVVRQGRGGVRDAKFFKTHLLKNPSCFQEKKKPRIYRGRKFASQRSFDRTALKLVGPSNTCSLHVAAPYPFGGRAGDRDLDLAIDPPPLRPRSRGEGVRKTGRISFKRYRSPKQTCF